MKIATFNVNGVNGRLPFCFAGGSRPGRMSPARHHIKEEEDEMLPKAQKAKLDFEALAAKMKRRKERLLEDGVPHLGEEVMVKASRGKGDSPARAAKRKPPKLPKGRRR
jgi:hypothetical protein